MRKDIVDQLLKEKGMTRKEFARLYKGKENEYWAMCNIKCGFKRAYQIAEIFGTTVDDIVTYGDEKWPRWHRPEDDGRTKAGREKRRKQREREKKEKKKNQEEEKLRRQYLEIFETIEELEKLDTEEIKKLEELNEEIKINE